MSQDTDETGDGVTVSVEIDGEYDEVISKLRSSEAESGDLGPLIGDVSTVLETIVRIDGGTRSAVADELPEGMAVTYDAEAVVGLLAVLERYDLITLEGNTWKPGPAVER